MAFLYDIRILIDLIAVLRRTLSYWPQYMGKQDDCLPPAVLINISTQGNISQYCKSIPTTGPGTKLVGPSGSRDSTKITFETENRINRR